MPVAESKSLADRFSDQWIGTARGPGKGGGSPRIGDVIAKDLNDDQAMELIRTCLAHDAAEAKPRERTARFMERIGVEAFKRAVLEG